MAKHPSIPLPDLVPVEIASIDPGKHTCAVALSDCDGRLFWVGPVTFTDWSQSRGSWAPEAIVEIPSGNGRTTPPDDLIAEAVHGCLLAGRICSGPVRQVSVAEWKGSCKKPIHHERMWGALNRQEFMLLGGVDTFSGIKAAQHRGAKECWRRGGAEYYRAGDLPVVEMSTGSYRLTHNELDAVALLLYGLGRIDCAGMPTKGRK